MSPTIYSILVAAAYGGLPVTYHGAADHGYFAPAVYSAPDMYGYGAPASVYGYPASSFNPCPVAAGAGGGYAISGPQSYGGSDAAGAPQGYQHQAAYGPQAGRPASAAAAVVHMTDKARFEPALVTINAGETVEWRSASRHAHTVTLDPGLAKIAAHVVLPEGAEPINSGEIAPGGRFTHTFTVPGTYFYVCLPHEEKGMVGIVVVQPPQDRGNGGEYRESAPGGAGGGY